MPAKITLKYILLLFIAVFLSCFFHELTHWLTARLLGYNMNMSLNTANLISGNYQYEWQKNLVTISAPIFTVVQAIVFYFVLDRTKNIKLYPYLFFPFVYRLSAGLANLLGPNDEGRFGLSLGIGLMTVSSIFCVFLLFLIYKSSIKNNISLKFNAVTFFLCVFSLLLITFIDQYFHIKIIK